MPGTPLVRVEDAVLGRDGQARLVVTGLVDPERLQRSWASSGVAPELVGGRLRATSTVQALERAAGRALDAEEAEALVTSLRQTVRAWAGPPPAVPLPDGSLPTDRRPLVMGIINVTPDSFSDGGLLYPAGHPETAIAHGRKLLAQGADLLDVGGESARPGSRPVAAEEERRRVLPVIERLAAEGACCSVDTVKADVARAAVSAGAALVNDVSGAGDPALLDAVAGSGAAYVLMHTRGTPADMQTQTDYTDVVAQVYEYLAAGLERCEAAGLPAERILVDPGIGFAKTAAQNLALLQALRQFTGLGRPVLVGASRKSFLGLLTEGPEGPAPADDRLEASLACAALAVSAGSSVLRVHEVRPTVRVAQVSRAIITGETEWPRDLTDPPS